MSIDSSNTYLILKVSKKKNKKGKKSLQLICLKSSIRRHGYFVYRRTSELFKSSGSYLLFQEQKDRCIGGLFIQKYKSFRLFDIR